MVDVSARGSPQMQVREPSACTPLDPHSGAFNGMLPSWDRTSAERIARQSLGSATGVAVGEGVGDADPPGVGRGEDVPRNEADDAEVPDPPGAADEQAASTPTRARVLRTVATVRVFMSPR